VITITPYPEERVDLYSSEDEFIGSVNQAELLDARIQIYLNKLDGYYIMTAFGRFNIDSSGDMDNWPGEVFSNGVKLARKLMSLQQNDIANNRRVE
jgi:hypothetical protein